MPSFNQVPASQTTQAISVASGALALGSNLFSLIRTKRWTFNLSGTSALTAMNVGSGGGGGGGGTPAPTTGQIWPR